MEDESTASFISKIRFVENEASVLEKNTKIAKKILRCLPPRFVLKISMNTNNIKFDQFADLTKFQDLRENQ